MPNAEYSFFGALLPFLEQKIVDSNSNLSSQYIPVKSLFNPADPTISITLSNKADVSSYAANSLCFSLIIQAKPAGQFGCPRLPQTFTDGTSNTIVFGEHYAYRCGGSNFNPFVTQISLGADTRRAAFADWLDCRDGSDGLTFQVSPKISECASGLAQTPHRSGMLVSRADGSVRTLGPNISAATYWAAMTPAGGETPGGDW